MPSELETHLALALKDTYETLEWVLHTQVKGPIVPHPFGLGVIMAKQNARSAIGEYNAAAPEDRQLTLEHAPKKV
jgi:hypothetical protein